MDTVTESWLVQRTESWTDLVSSDVVLELQPVLVASKLHQEASKLQETPGA